LATGGTSHPETGSTGDGFKWLKKLGHTIIENDFALVPIVVKDEWAKKLGGVALSDIKIISFLDGVRQSAKIGRVLFTHFGLSGPTILNMARYNYAFPIGFEEVEEIIKAKPLQAY
jgi:predicted flavoprotein YhiN